MLYEVITMEVPNVSGELKQVTVGFQASFDLGGLRLALLPMAVSDDEVFFVFRDRTSGRETYGAGRFLKAEPAVDGRIRLDFNRAFVITSYSIHYTKLYDFKRPTVCSF